LAVLISHRIFSVRMAGRILVLSDGRAELRVITTSIKERNMDEANHRDSADPHSLEAGRLDVLKEILATTEGIDAEASDDDLDAWWGTVEIDRLANGLTLDAIGKLSEPGQRDDSSGPWIQKSDPKGDEITQLTPDGRAAVRRVLAA
jgi:alkanesulfonate monooxygenase SsuD/methylene tetrahydromethanopterin reductase-like flavin-dependent oxidoreductase (luciferase family)